MQRGRYVGSLVVSVVVTLGAVFAGCLSNTPPVTPELDSGAPVSGDSAAPSSDAAVADAGGGATDATIVDSSPGTDSASPATTDASDGSAPADASDASSEDAGPCPHALCVPGAKLAASCESAGLCSGSSPTDPYCCAVAWDLNCVVEEGTTCAASVADGGYFGLGGTVQSVAQVSAGPYGSCAVTTTGDLYCWGTSDNGGIGDGRPAASAYFPRKVGSGFANVMAGSPEAICALGTDQGLRCWGTAASAFLSDGGETSVPPTTPQITGVTQISAGSDVHNGVGIGCAVTTTGQTYCSGYTTAQELAPGIPSTSNQPDIGTGPALVGLSDAGAPGAATITNVFVGGDSACVLVTGGSPVCWGSNFTDALGGSAGGYAAIACIPSGEDAGNSGCASPITGIVKVAVGSSATCMLNGSGAVYCVGQNTNGELAQGNTTGTYPYPLAAQVPPARDIAAGIDFFCAAPTDTTAEVVCWGATNGGELGNGDAGGATGVGTPIAVPGLTGVLSLSGATGPATGIMCAVKQDGSLWCWGDDSYSQLGIYPQVSSSPAPTRVPVLAFP